jgi:membrane protein DedA with SNARE-associated domain
VDLAALLFLAAVLAVKEAGLPIPVPGDVLVIGAGVAASRGGLPVVLIVVVLIAATVTGGIVQFVLVRGRARSAILGLLARFGLRQTTVERSAARLRNGGAATIAVARMTPGVRIVTIASSAIAGVATASFLTGLIVGNGVFLTGHFLLGLVVGEPAVRLVAGAGLGLIAVGVGLAGLGAAGWWLIARRRSRLRAAAGGESAGEGLAPLDWSDACCPACLALAVVVPGRLGGDRPDAGSSPA